MESNYPLVSVLVPAYNHENYIRENIETIWQQDYPAIEIIVLDDCSPDETYNIAQKLADESHIPMQVGRNSSNLGPVKTCNNLLKEANGEFLIYLSSDDKFADSNVISKSAEILMNNPAIQIVYGNAYRWNSNSGEKSLIYTENYKFLERKISSKDTYDYVIRSFKHFLIQTALIRKTMLDAIGGYDEDLLADDWVLNIKIFKYLTNHNLDYYLIPTAVCCYRQHDNNIHRNHERQIQSIWEVAHRYCPSPNMIMAYEFSDVIIHSILREKKPIKNAWHYFADKRNPKLLCLGQLFYKIVTKSFSKLFKNKIKT